MSKLDLIYKWSDTNSQAVDAEEVTATLARFQILVDKTNVTEHKSPRGKPEPVLQIPTYYLAEWLSENWWVILFEPRKDEVTDDSAYLTRHSIVAAQHGFPLPSLTITPFGRGISLNSSRRHAQFANIEFTKSAFADASRDEIESTLSSFVDGVVERLLDRGVSGTSLEAAWAEIKSLTADEREFCELTGSLGLGPAEVSEDLTNALEHMHEILGQRAMRDFCLAGTADLVRCSMSAAESVVEFLKEAADAKLGSLFNVTLPPENFSRPSWQRGMQAARRVREAFNINVRDDSGADKLFEVLNIDTKKRAIVSNMPSNDLPFSGAIDRQDDVAKLALVQEDELHRRFSASRAAYLAWASEGCARRLVTNAVTRDQQASRSFAAEMLIPQAHLSRLTTTGELHAEQIREIARERRVMPDVVYKQAHNAGIRVPSWG